MVIEEINTAHAIILFKGHKKDQSSEKSYRTISSCPVIAKALDLHIRDCEIGSGLEKVWYPGILVTSQCQILQPIFAGPKALTATI